MRVAEPNRGEGGEVSPSARKDGRFTTRVSAASPGQTYAKPARMRPPARSPPRCRSSTDRLRTRGASREGVRPRAAEYKPRDVDVRALRRARGVQFRQGHGGRGIVRELDGAAPRGRRRARAQPGRARRGHDQREADRTRSRRPVRRCLVPAAGALRDRAKAIEVDQALPDLGPARAPRPSWSHRADAYLAILQAYRGDDLSAFDARPRKISTRRRARSNISKTSKGPRCARRDAPLTLALTGSAIKRSGALGRRVIGNTVGSGPIVLGFRPSAPASDHLFRTCCWAPMSSGPGHCPLTAKTRVRLPLGVPPRAEPLGRRTRVLFLRARRRALAGSTPVGSTTRCGSNVVEPASSFCGRGGAPWRVRLPLGVPPRAEPQASNPRPLPAGAAARPGGFDSHWEYHRGRTTGRRTRVLFLRARRRALAGSTPVGSTTAGEPLAVEPVSSSCGFDSRWEYQRGRSVSAAIALVGDRRETARPSTQSFSAPASTQASMMPIVAASRNGPPCGIRAPDPPTSRWVPLSLSIR